MMAYVDGMPSGQASISDLKDFLRRLAIDPRHAMSFTKKLLIKPE